MKTLTEIRKKTVIEINDLPIDNATKRLVTRLRDKLAAYTGIVVNVVSFDYETLTVTAEQKELRNNYILSQNDIATRAKAVFEPLNGKFKIHYRALSYNPSLFEIDAAWIESKMAEFKMKRSDILKQIGLDKSTLSVLLSGTKPLTRFQRAAFYYYFMTFELNMDFRESFEKT